MHNPCTQLAVTRLLWRIDISCGVAQYILLVTVQAAVAAQIARDREQASRGRSLADVKAATRRANDEKAAQWAAAVLADRAEKALQRRQKLAELEALRVQVI